MHDLYRTLDPYSRPPSRARATQRAATEQDSPQEPVPLACSPPASAKSSSDHERLVGERLPVDVQACKPVVASRIKWKYAPTFDPTPFLKDPLARAAFEDPNALRLPPSEWPRVPKARVHATRDELIKLARVWDSVGALRIFRQDEISDMTECVGLFCVPKDDQYDRLILNPVVVNSRMLSLNTYTKLLGHGAQLCSLHIPPGHVARFSADDLAEFYYTVKVGTARAKRNVIGVPFASDELSGMKSFDKRLHYGTCYLALACLAMGDNMAVELAQASHCEVLRSLAGCMLPHETVSFRRPFPRGSFCEFLCIDDHVGIQVLSKAAARAFKPSRDSEVFSASNHAYKKVGLVPHPTKCLRDQPRGTILGSEFDGEAGFVSAPLDRILCLMLCTAEVARRGSCTPQLLGSLLGCWIHVLMFRRPALCVLNAAFSEAAATPADRVRAALPSHAERASVCVMPWPSCAD